MSFDNWDDDLLNFDYSNPVPQERPASSVTPSEMKILDTPQQVDDAIRREEERARKLREEYERLREAAKAQREQQRLEQTPVEIPRRVQQPTEPASRPVSGVKVDKAATAARRAGKAAKKVSGFAKFTKFLSIPYVLFLGVFVVAMTLMNVLPFFYWVLMLVVLGLLSLIIVLQLRRPNVKKWAKVVATFTAVVLMFFFGLGTVYSMGTLSFLDKTSVKNDDKVAHITKEPFNVLITGMDVWGKIDEPGRSDVNMLVTVNPKTEQLLMTSIPRDYQVYMPDMGGAMDKLTHTGFYSVETTIGAVEDLLNTKTNYYVKVNFSTIVKFIDAIGGLDFKNDIEFTSDITGHLYEKGFIHVQGRGALYYARERHAFVDGDNQRIKNQQKIFSEMLKKATSSKTMLLSYSKILSALDDYFEMSISSSEIRSLMKLQIAKNIDWQMYKNSVVGGNGSMPTYTTGGQKCYVMTQDPDSIANAQNLIQAVLNGQELTKDKDGNVTVKTEATGDAA